MIKDILLSSFFYGIHPCLLALCTKNINKIDLIFLHILLSIVILFLIFSINYNNIINKFNVLRGDTINRGKYLYGFFSTMITNFFVLFDIYVYTILVNNTYLYTTLYYCFTILFSAFVISKYLKKRINYKSILSILFVLFGIFGVLRG